MKRDGVSMKRGWVHAILGAGAMAAAGIGSGCGSHGTAAQADAGPPTTYLSRSAMLAPENCASCHMTHYNDWSASMHAQAADDPVFRAMNARGQRETNHALGTFCVQCHAPMAVRDGMTTDGLNLDSLPAYYKGVTCFFCHSIDSVGPSHVNADVDIASDLVMRGEIMEPQANVVHASAYSTFHDNGQANSAAMCGSCHDITAMAGAHIERTFAEWSASAFSEPEGGETCTACHMIPLPVKVAIATGGPATREYHPHDFPAVDVPLVANAPTTSVQNALDNDALQGALCVTVNSGIRVILDTAGIGHDWPSGAAQDRRAWAEVIAYDASGAQIYSSGVVPDGTPVTSIQDPDLWLLRDCMFDAQSQPVPNFWQAATTNGYELPALLTSVMSDPRFYLSHIVQSYPRANSAMPTLKTRPARVTLRLRLQPVGLDVLNDLVDSGDLDAGPDGALLANMPTFDVSLQGPIGAGFAAPGPLVWTPTTTNATYTDPDQGPATCIASPGFNPVAAVQAGSAATCTPP